MFKYDFSKRPKTLYHNKVYENMWLIWSWSSVFPPTYLVEKSCPPNSFDIANHLISFEHIAVGFEHISAGFEQPVSELQRLLTPCPPSTSKTLYLHVPSSAKKVKKVKQKLPACEYSCDVSYASAEIRDALCFRSTALATVTENDIIQNGSVLKSTKLL